MFDFEDQQNKEEHETDHSFHRRDGSGSFVFHRAADHTARIDCLRAGSGGSHRRFYGI